VIDLSIIFIFNKLYIVFCSVLKKKGDTGDCALAHADERSAKIKIVLTPLPPLKKPEHWNNG
jgi:hypothetical protein